ncbi:MAG: beta-N-acetylhexosaminidase [Candidatus Sumerlaeota bacterium]|nr:beta-N-acetylhexosaminidase [Candidatus Sumerlaeota bacterium]
MTVVSGCAGPAVSILPKPLSLTRGQGVFTLSKNTIIVTDDTAKGTGAHLAAMLRPATGLPLKVKTGQDTARNCIALSVDAALAKLGDEGYSLEVTPEKVTIRAPKTAGVFYGCQTLRQLLPPQIFSAQKASGVAWTIPAVKIEDSPRFGWRGAMLDVSRHFFPKEFILRFLDVMALHKLNRFHWHLTDDQGWRIEIKKYPKLTEVGAWRKETLVGHLRDYNKKPESEYKNDGKRHGGFYSQDDIREIVRYAAERNITIVPEIEMPGHAQAAIAAYPELGVSGKPLPVRTFWGIDPNIFNPEEKTILFLQDVLTEVLELFPGQFIHIGGDEAVKDQWKKSEKVQARIKALGLKDEHEMQSYFIQRMDKFLASKGRRLIGWDEILEGGLAPGATVMSWRGEKGGITAAKSGHDVVMAPNTYTYFDYYQTADTKNEPLAIGGNLPLEKVYGYNPIPKDLGQEEIKHVLGTQGQIWTEYIADGKNAEYMTFPRLTALAEVAWTPQETRSYPDFQERLQAHLKRLNALSVNYHPLK